MARPHLYSEQLNLRLTEEMRAALDAARGDKTRGHFIREVLVHTLRDGGWFRPINAKPECASDA